MAVPGNGNEPLITRVTMSIVDIHPLFIHVAIIQKFVSRERERKTTFVVSELDFLNFDFVTRTPLLDHYLCRQNANLYNRA